MLSSSQDQSVISDQVKFGPSKQMAIPAKNQNSSRENQRLAKLLFGVPVCINQKMAKKFGCNCVTK